MVVLRKRVQRAALVSNAAELEHKIGIALALTEQRRKEADDMGLAIPEAKLFNRWQQLTEARELVNKARQIIWDAL